MLTYESTQAGMEVLDQVLNTEVGVPTTEFHRAHMDFHTHKNVPTTPAEP